MQLALTAGAEAPARWPMRAVVQQDEAALGALMYAAYHGTIDDEGESPEECVAEMGRTFDGAYGPLLGKASFVIEELGRVLAATLVTLWHDAPLLTYVMARPEAQGRGMGGELIGASTRALLAGGYSELILYVTEGNVAAQRLYARLGFIVVDTRRGDEGGSA